MSKLNKCISGLKTNTRIKVSEINMCLTFTSKYVYPFTPIAYIHVLKVSYLHSFLKTNMFMKVYIKLVQYLAEQMTCLGLTKNQ